MTTRVIIAAEGVDSFTCFRNGKEILGDKNRSFLDIYVWEDGILNILPHHDDARIVYNAGPGRVMITSYNPQDYSMSTSAVVYVEPSQSVELETDMEYRWKLQEKHKDP